MSTQPFFGELLVEDYSSGFGFPVRKMLYVMIWETRDGNINLELHNNPPDGINTLIGRYGHGWLLLKVKWKLFVTVYELTNLLETPPLKVRCVTGHKFGKMIEKAILKYQQQNP